MHLDKINILLIESTMSTMKLLLSYSFSFERNALAIH